jgi:hypothetical protein
MKKSPPLSTRLFNIFLTALTTFCLAVLALGALGAFGPPWIDAGALFPGSSSPAEIAGPGIPRGIIRPDDETFDGIHRELHDHSERYRGRTIEVTGTVTREGVASADEFLVGRTLQWCCENDRVFIGFLARTSGDLPREGEGVRIQGVLVSGVYRNPETGKRMAVPAIRAREIRPDRGYSEVVYPSR